MKKITILVSWMLVVSFAQAVIVIDDFKTNDPSGYWQLKCTTANVPVYGSETGLAGTYGGTRAVMFNTNSAGSLGSSLFIGYGEADLSNGPGKYSLAEFTYDAGGSGLGLDLTSGTMFSVKTRMDHVGYQKDSVLRITLSDGSQTSSVEKRWTTYVVIGEERTYNFLFSDFLAANPALNLQNIASIKLYVETDMAGDYVLLANFTTDAIPEPATIGMLALGALTLLRKRK